jgi:hypothetical protein
MCSHIVGAYRSRALAPIIVDRRASPDVFWV